MLDSVTLHLTTKVQHKTREGKYDDNYTNHYGPKYRVGPAPVFFTQQLSAIQIKFQRFFVFQFYVMHFFQVVIVNTSHRKHVNSLFYSHLLTFLDVYIIIQQEHPEALLASLGLQIHASPDYDDVVALQQLVPIPIRATILLYGIYSNGSPNLVCVITVLVTRPQVVHCSTAMGELIQL